MKLDDAILRDVPLGPRTTLGVGGPARFLLEVTDETVVRRGLEWAAEGECPVLVLGGGSNVLVADSGFDGLVLCMKGRGARFGADGRVVASAAEPWDALVAEATRRGLAGLECLSGIPGLAGAAPIQNIGAYGQELAEVLESVRVVERSTGRAETLGVAGCGFGYRTSRFKAEGEHVVVEVRLHLRPGGAPTLRYPELRGRVPDGAGLEAVREVVLDLRRGKSMLVEADDPNRRSAGSFFLNPVVGATEAERVAALAPEGMPRYPQPDGRVKLSAAWLIERAGLSKGHGEGPVGLSTRHTLAIVNRGEAQAADLLRFAGQVRTRVFDRFGVTLSPEPVFVGFEAPVEVLLSS